TPVPRLASMGAQIGPADHHLVALDDLIVDEHSQIRAGGHEIPKRMFEMVGPARLARVGAVVDKLWVEDIVERVEVAPVHRVGDAFIYKPGIGIAGGLLGHVPIALPIHSRYSLA